MSRPLLYRFDDANITITGELIYYDTSVIIEQWGKSEKPFRQKEVQEFHNRVAREGAISVSGILGQIEIRTAVTGAFVKAARTNKHRSRKLVIANNAGIMKQVAQTSRSIYEAMERDINHIILPQTYITLELIEEVDNLMSQCDIEYIDALHYAIAKKEGIKLIATLDSDYMNIPDPNLKILTDSENYQKLLARYGITITAANI